VLCLTKPARMQIRCIFPEQPDIFNLIPRVAIDARVPGTLFATCPLRVHALRERSKAVEMQVAPWRPL
jgi:hypothetical protein